MTTTGRLLTPGAVQTPGYSLPVLVEPTTDVQVLILDYRKKHGIDEEIVDIDGFGAYWRRKA